MAKTVRKEPESCDPKTKRSPAGRRSGGPRTALGKNRSKYNARTHGIFSKVVVLDGESRSEFDAQLAGLREHFRPVGAFRDGLVEILAVTRWRQRRLLVAALDWSRWIKNWRSYATTKPNGFQFSRNEWN